MVNIAGLHYDGFKPHMVCTNGLPGIPQCAADIALRLQKLATEIEEIATSMDYYGGFGVWVRHSREMFGAAGICREWSLAILADQVECGIPGTK